MAKYSDLAVSSAARQELAEVSEMLVLETKHKSMPTNPVIKINNTGARIALQQMESQPCDPST